jgi:1,4-dihydroxy-2-naphthoyl-CoA hydrolase
MSIWKVEPDVKVVNEMHANTVAAQLGIAFTEIGEDFVRGTMPVDGRTRQPMGLLHGGATVVLAETLASDARPGPAEVSTR